MKTQLIPHLQVGGWRVVYCWLPVVSDLMTGDRQQTANTKQLIATRMRLLARASVSIVLLVGLVACQQQSRPASKVAQEAAAASKQDVERSLTFSNVTLEQANDKGQPVWEVKAEQATYSKDRKVALLESPKGRLFQDGKPVYEITAKQGEIQQDGKQLFLKGLIVATDPRNGLVLRGNELEWRPQEDLLVVRNQLTGTHKQVRAKAQEARVYSRASRIELSGGVEAIATNPVVQMQTEQLVWLIQAQKLIGERPIRFDRYQGKQITDRATANQAEFDLKTEVATLKQNAQLNLLEPPMQINSNLMNWNLNAETVTADQSVKIVHRQQQVTATAEQGRMDLQTETVYLTDDVRTVSQRGQSLQAKAVTWYVPKQLFEANGDVFYQQKDPPASFKGQKAEGKLADQNLVVSGGRVTTEIIPQEKP